MPDIIVLSLISNKNYQIHKMLKNIKDVECN